MRQKLGLAAALVHRPRLLLLDEPTGGVDPVTRQDFWQLLIRLVREERVGVLVSTPYMDEAVRCTYVGMMVGGRLVLEGSPDRLLEDFGGEVLELHGSQLQGWRQAAAQIPEVQDAQVFGNRLHLRILPGGQRRVVRRLRQIARQTDLTIEEIAPAAPTLEDVFISVLADHLETTGLYQINGGAHG